MPKVSRCGCNVGLLRGRACRMLSPRSSTGFHYWFLATKSPLLFLIMKEVHFWELVGEVEVGFTSAELGGAEELLLG